MRNFRINAMTVLILGLNVAVVNATDGKILNVTTIDDPDNANKIEATNVKGPGHTAVGQQNQIYSVPESEEMSYHYREESKSSSSAIGNQNTVKGYSANAVGTQNHAYGYDAQSFGMLNKVYSHGSIAFGLGNKIGAPPPRDNNQNITIPMKDIVPDEKTISSAAFGLGNTALGSENLVVGHLSNVAGTHSIAIGTESTANGTYALAIGVGAVAQPVERETQDKVNTSIAIGAFTEATAADTVAMGMYAKASGDDAIAIGTSATANKAHTVTIGASATSTGEWSTALGDSANAKDDNSVALGSGTITREATQENEATVNGIKYSGFAGHDPLSVVSVGSDKTETYTQKESGYTAKIKPHTRQIINVGAGKISATSTDAINGSQLYMIAEQVGKNKKLIDNISALSSGAKLEAGDNIDVETHDDANQVKTYKVSTKKDIKANSYTINNSSIKIDQNGINAGNKKVINVANGENDSDAVNVSQLNKVKSDMANNTKAINTLNKKVNDVDRKSRAGIAGVAAIASAPSARKDGRSMVSTGVAHHRGESAIAIKASRNSDNGHWSSNVNGATDTRGQWTVGAGVGYEW